MASDVSTMTDRVLLELVLGHCQHLRAAVDSIHSDQKLFTDRTERLEQCISALQIGPLVSSEAAGPIPVAREVQLLQSRLSVESNKADADLYDFSQDESDKNDEKPLDPDWPQNLTARQFTASVASTQSHSSSSSNILPKLSAKAVKKSMSRSRRPSFYDAIEIAIEPKDGRPSELGRKFMVEPTSWQRVSFDVGGMLILAVDLVITPPMLAWDLPQEGFVFGFTVVGVIFWTMDMMLNLRTGFYRKGKLIMTPYAVFCRYAQTTLLPDCTVVLVDWLSVLTVIMSPGGAQSDSSFSGVKLIRLTKITRLLRIFALLRLAHLAEYIERLGEQMSDAGAFKYVLDILKIIAIILWVNHVICCLWYGLGVSLQDGADTGQNWLSDPLRNSDDPSYGTIGPLFQYTSSYHWALTQMTPGSMQVVPRNSVERIFNNVVLIFGMLFFSGLVSTLSATIVNFRMRGSGTAAKMSQLRRFLRQSCISTSLSMSIQKEVFDRLTSPKPLLFTDVDAIGVLSKSMHSELMFHLCKPHLLRHGLFHILQIIDNYKFKEVLENCINFGFINPGDTVFCPGETATYAYYLESGMLRYVQTLETSNDEEDLSLEDHKDMICEVALWTNWIHVGTLKAKQPTVLMSIDAKKHEDCLCSGDNVIFHNITSEYSRLYHERVVSSTSPQALPNDIYVSSANFKEILVSSSTDMRQVISLALFASLKNPIFGGFHFTGVNALDSLEKEIMQGKCVLTLNDKGETQRLLAVSVLELVIGGASILAEIGTWSLETADLKVCCKLPGGKRRLPEPALTQLRRVMSTELSALQKYVDLTQAATSLEEEEMVSETYKIQTTYVRSVFHCEIEEIPRDAVMWLEVEEPGILDQVFAVSQGDKLKLYAFLPLHQFERFRNKPEEQEHLKACLQKYKLDACVAKRATEWEQQCTDHVEQPGAGVSRGCDGHFSF